MSKVLVLYYSSYGHIEQMAQAIAEGARSAGAQVDIKRVPETVPEAIAKSAHFKLEQKAPVAEVAELADYDAVAVDEAQRPQRSCCLNIHPLPEGSGCSRKIMLGFFLTCGMAVRRQVDCGTKVGRIKGTET
jgi:hypothetical protein